jgi:hypothetical protein
MYYGGMAKLSILFLFLLPLVSAFSPPLSTARPRISTITKAVALPASDQSTLNKNPIVIFPAQFGVAKDYEEMIAELNSRGHPAYAVDLSRFDWLKITKSAITQGTESHFKDCLKTYRQIPHAF